MTDRPRVTFEKSRVVRRRYQRSNQRFQFTASQIARIEREEQRKSEAEKLREKEKRRLKQKKQRAEKEAKAREGRKRLGLPDPNAAKVPASQPLLSNFIMKKTSAAKPTEAEDDSGDQSDSTIVGGTMVASDVVCDHDLDGDLDDEFDNDTPGFEDEGIDDLLLELGAAVEPKKEKSEGRRAEESRVTAATEEGDFSDCSFDFFEDVIEATEPAVKTIPSEQIPVLPVLASQDSFADDTAMLLEELRHEFDPSSSFDAALLQLDEL
ncbi:hypothetical protein BJX64DRAFT_282594 [Aspergillus heterothallicus]